MSDYFRQNLSICSFDTDESWVILSEIEQSIKKKVESEGTPLKDWDIRINYGIKTGYNEAFVVSGHKRQEILDNCITDIERERTSKIIRPLLRGRDIKRYGHDFADLWLLYIPWHFPLHLDETIKGVSHRAEALFERDYTSVYNHLSKHKDKLMKRNQAETGIRYEWYALQRWGANYWEDFSEQKIMYNDIATTMTFGYAPEGYTSNNTVYFIAGAELVLQSLLPVLNSKLMEWYYRTICAQLGNNAIRMFSIYVNALPVSKECTEYIMDNIKIESITDFLQHEEEINTVICEKYNLTKEESEYITSLF